MGYNTDFSGSLKFNRVLTEAELAYIESMFWLECDDYEKAGWIHPKGAPHYIQLQLTHDNTGIQWDGSEKFYEAVEAVNFIIANAKAKIPDFALSGQMEAQGESMDDRWVLRIGRDGWAEKVEAPTIGTKIACPHCGKSFALAGAA